MNQDEVFMKQAIELSKKTVKHGNEPFGAVLVKNNEVVSFSKTLLTSPRSPQAFFVKKVWQFFVTILPAIEKTDHFLQQKRTKPANRHRLVLSLFFSSNSSKKDSKNVHNQGNSHKYIFCQWFKPPAKGFCRSQFHLFSGIAFWAYPEKHNACQQCTKRNDINRYGIHPGTNFIATFNKDSHRSRNHCSHAYRCSTRQFKLLLQCLDWCLKQVHQ